MRMRFTCICCGKKLTRSYGTDRVNGDIYAQAWYVDSTGLKHLAIVCLACGTIHDCSGSFLRGLLTLGRSPVTIHRDINPLELSAMIMDRSQHPELESREVAIRQLGIPEGIIDVLLERNILGQAFVRRCG